MVTYLHAFRGIAALLVVLYHSAAISEKYFEDVSFERFFLFGEAGVVFFFVLSGFIIVHAHKNWIGQSHKAKDYLLRRFIRVYPVYWVVFIITLPLYYFLYRDIPPLFEMLKSFLLIEHEMIVYVAWTLVHEMTFYLAFLVLIFSKRLGILLFAVWLVAILFNSPAAIFNEAWFNLEANHLFANYNLLFFLGMLAALLASNEYKARSPLLIGIAGIVGFFSTRFAEIALNADGTLDAFYALSSFLIIYGFAKWELPQRNYKLPPKFFMLLGTASYSIYLVHSQVVSGMTKLFLVLGLHNVMHVFTAFVISALVATLAGIVFYKQVEEPLLQLSKKHLLKNKQVVKA